MINHKHNFLFVKVAKTASTSLISSLPKTKTPPNDWPYDQNHIPLWYYKDSILKGSSYENFFKFAFVRNPYDRAVSTWKYWNKFNQSQGGEALDFKTLLMLKSDSINKKQFSSKYSSQYEFTKGCDFIGRFENLQEDFDTVCNHIGIESKKLPFKNKTSHNHYSEYYNDETRRIVEEKYSKDLTYFNYEF